MIQADYCFTNNASEINIINPLEEVGKTIWKCVTNFFHQKYENLKMLGEFLVDNFDVNNPEPRVVCVLTRHPNAPTEVRYVLRRVDVDAIRANALFDLHKLTFIGPGGPSDTEPQIYTFAEFEKIAQKDSKCKMFFDYVTSHPYEFGVQRRLCLLPEQNEE
jgi:hypothetical protein